MAWILKILISCARDIYLLKSNAAGTGLINQDIKQELLSLAEKFSFADLYRILAGLSDSQENLRGNINPKLLFDNLDLLWKR